MTARFDSIGIPGHGPGAELLGAPKTALDLGPAEGENAAFLARSGIQLTAVDFSPVQTAPPRSQAEGASLIIARSCQRARASTMRSV